MKSVAAILLALASAIPVAADCAAQSIDWEVADRFRLFTDPRHQNAYLNARQTILKTKGYRPPLLQPKNDLSLGWAINWPTRWNESTEQYDRNWIHQRNRTIRIKLTGVPQGAVCRWSLDAGTSCKERTLHTQVGVLTKITVDVVRNGAIVKKLNTDIEPKDIFIMVMGDSVGSGEGNPHLSLRAGAGDNDTVRYPAIWWDTHCHRSLLSGPAQAAVVYAERHPRQSVTFVSYACSGAEINDGVLTTYQGRETVNQIKQLLKDYGQEGNQIAALKGPNDTLKPAEHKLRSQIDRAAEVLCPLGEAACVKKQPDILIVAVGGNDIGFGEIGRTLLLSDPGPNVGEWRKKQQGDITPYFKKLSEDYSALAPVVRERIAPKSVLLMEYIDPSMYGQDKFCGRERTSFGKAAGKSKKDLDKNDPSGISTAINFSLYNLLVMREESRLAHWIVGGLNDRIRQAAALTWTAGAPGGTASVVPLQDMRGPDGLRRGLCATNSWFIGIGESLLRQGWISSDPVHKFPLKLTDKNNCPYPLENDVCKAVAGNVTSGILHPNFFGHYNAARQILLQMEAVLPKN